MADRAITVAAWESLFRAQVTIMRALAAEFPSEVISLNEYDVLFNISRAPSRRLRLKDLNRNVLITQPSVSRLVDRLTARGLVVKLPDPDDGRGTIVGITESGFELFREVAIEHMGAITRHVGHALDERELKDLIDLCDRLRLGVRESAGPAANGTADDELSYDV
ncbi:MarR family transcriptional regulator [Agromyces sp. SYSU K20354]|uniref:MarR family winged helix-turn-helix transcriptional regulator n=1 Tax=Agromyces cavernae TaxID=2898659 RepID=UPI001E3146B3|nr:MarR family transcriptional regulator [Agromyces cavernae]MCD2443541.1 MarR family transcriptional regulator [Agromyces cavernae]